MSSTIKQIQVSAAGATPTVANVATPQVQPGHVVVRVRAAAMNPMDWKRRDLGFTVDSWPATLGYDTAGVVEAVGEGVSGFVKGDEVVAMSFNQGFSEVIVTPAIVVAKKPSRMSFEDGASLPIGYLTGVAGIYLGLKISPWWIDGASAQSAPIPKSVLVLGGSSVVGAATIQLLRLALPAGTPIFATSSPLHFSHIEKLGATKVFDRNSATLVKDIQSAVPEGIDAILDTVAGGKNTDIFNVLSKSGLRLLSEIETLEGEFSKPGDITVNNTGAAQVMEAPGGVNAFAGLARLLAENKYTVPVPITLVGESIEDVPTAVDRMKKGVSGTKLVVTF